MVFLENLLFANKIEKSFRTIFCGLQNNLPDFSALLKFSHNPSFSVRKSRSCRNLSESKIHGRKYLPHSPSFSEKLFDSIVKRPDFPVSRDSKFLLPKIFLCFPSEKIGRKILEYTLLLLQKNYSMALLSGQIFLFYPGILDSFPHDSVKRPFA